MSQLYKSCHLRWKLFQLVIMTFLSFLFVLYLFLPKQILIECIGIINPNYFCHMYCGHTHVCCRRAPCKLATTICSKNSEYIINNDNARNFILNQHNKLRSDVATGVEKPKIKSSNMNALIYSKEMEFVAQCWANNCVLHFAPCSATSKFPDVGTDIPS